MDETLTLPAKSETIPVAKEIVGTLELTHTYTGIRINLNIVSSSDAFAKMRKLGTMGWTSGEIPDGGLILSYDMVDLYDWALIGANEGTFQAIEDGETITKKCVYYRGSRYTRRDNLAKKENGVSYPAMISYSRGAKETDPVHIREGATGLNKGYITLARFKGRGPIVKEICKPKLNN